MTASASASAAFALEDIPGLEPASPVPLYAQLAERFAALIGRSQEALVGKVLPSESECMFYFKVSRPTVRQAMAQLLSQGLITRGRGRGTFVAPQRVDHDICRAFEDEMRAANRSVAFELLEWVTVTPTEGVRAALQLAGAEPVERVKRRLLLEGEIFGFEERFLPSRYKAQLTAEALASRAIVPLIREVTGETPVRLSLTVRSIPADAESAQALRIKRGRPLLSTEHVYVLPSGAPALYGAVLFDGDRYQFSFQTPLMGASWPRAVLALPTPFHSGGKPSRVGGFDR